MINPVAVRNKQGIVNEYSDVLWKEEATECAQKSMSDCGRPTYGSWAPRLLAWACQKEVTTPAARIAGSEQGKRDSDEVWRQRRSKDGAEQGALSVFVYCRDQALSVSVRRAQSVFVCRRERALSVSVYRRDSRIE
ncbi:hypothetical protein NDU88_005185 [Pleurodeles waltl]|uniref:Uncharacterized protein n=1 Tax=Pleurodeles waltl TaxID=8319 RepID=A0AAV7LKD4_PLEWA|nr:hypothetical protein NDU88_005185 [Pleurodeles waltl]